MIRVVLDTNIVVSALLQPVGPPAQILLLGIGESIQLCISGPVYAEYEEVISRPRFRRTEDVIAGALRSIREKSLWVRPTEAIRVCSDPDDDIFLECSHAAQASYLVTGNLKHFPTVWSGNANRLGQVLAKHHLRWNGRGSAFSLTFENQGNGAA